MYVAYGLGAVLLVILLGVAKGYITGTFAKGVDQANKEALEQDLIETKVELEGWKNEIAKGNLTDSDYKAALSADLDEMHERLSGYHF